MLADFGSPCRDLVLLLRRDVLELSVTKMVVLRKGICRYGCGYRIHMPFSKISYFKGGFYCLKKR